MSKCFLRGAFGAFVQPGEFSFLQLVQFFVKVDGCWEAYVRVGKLIEFNDIEIPPQTPVVGEARSVRVTVQ